MTSMKTIHSFSANAIDGKPVSLEDFKGKVLLIVNTASRCGFTPQYQGLEQLHRTYQDQGFAVLGFPCNQFGQQEPGSNPEIGAFCTANYGVSFPMFEKIDVNGDHAHPLYQYLKSAAAGVLGSHAIKWNFTKFLIDRNGQVVKRYAPFMTPAAMGSDIERWLELPPIQ